MKKIAVLFLSVILLAFSFAVLPACENNEDQPAAKRIVGIDSQKIYLKNDYRRGAAMERDYPMQLPIVSLDPINIEEIESVTLKYEHMLEISGYYYELDDYGKSVEDGYYRYDLYISLYGYPATRHVIGIIVTINGHEYNFSADLWFNWDVDIPTVQASRPIQIVEYSVADSVAEANLKISLDGEIDITDVSFRIGGITITRLEYYDNTTDKWELLSLPYNALNANNMLLKIKYTEPEDCLYYGGCVQMTFNLNSKSQTVDTTTDFIPIRYLGSALRG